MAPSAAASGSDMTGLIAAAKAEGGLTTIALPRSWCGYGALLDGFTAKYGIPINNLNPDGSSQQELDAITANKANKGPAAPDVIDVGLSYGPKAVSAGLVAPYKVSTWADIADSAKDPSGNWYGDYYGVMSFEVNTSVIKTVPQDWSDLLTAGRTRSPSRATRRSRTRRSPRSGRRPSRTADRSTTPSRASTSSRS